MRDDTYKYCSGGLQWSSYMATTYRDLTVPYVRVMLYEPRAAVPPKRKAVSELRGQAAKRQTPTGINIS